MAQDNARREGVSPQTDELAASLLGEALDALADGMEMGVLMAAQLEDGKVVSCEFTDDGAEACLEGAHERVAQLAGEEPAAVRYAIAYEGGVEAEDGSGFEDAVLLEFGERGWRAYSAFSLIDGKGSGDGFAWSDPQPAGELEPLL